MRRVILLLMILGVVLGACVQKKNQVIKIKHEQEIIQRVPLALTVTFDDYGEKQLAYDERTYSIDTLLWAKHEQDSIVYFNITLKNLNEKKFVLKTELVATRIPFLLVYSKGEQPYSAILEVVQQFNTVHQDSLILNICEANETSFIQKAYHVNYAKNARPYVDELHIKQYNDTIEVVSRF